jgi:hypothetical protein
MGDTVSGAEAVYLVVGGGVLVLGAAASTQPVPQH